MHVEDMHARRSTRMVLVRFDGETEPVFPAELELVVRERNDGTILLEHQGELRTLLAWLATAPVRDLAIGTEDLRSLYDRYHGPDAQPDFTEALEA